jgi:NAD(P)-dependent dehydrogenase (short-subunit alcohol dehydrogenase family)
MKLEHKVAIVTGAGRGIGRAIAERFAEEGARVVIAEVDPDTGFDAARCLGNRATFIETDLADISAIDALVARTVAECGGLDILVNNAGVTRKLDFFAVTPEDWDWMHGVNARGVFFCMQRAAREMVKVGHGRIVNIASIAGKGYPGTSNIAYAASKGAVIAMTRVGASQLARHNINVNAICPGVTRTPLAEEVLAADGGEMLRRVEQTIPLRRANRPEDMANMAAFLASAEADNITGQSFNVDGGLMWD